MNSGPLCLFVADFVPDEVLDQLNPALQEEVQESTIDLPFSSLSQSTGQADLEQVQGDKAFVPREPLLRKRVRWAEADNDGDDNGESSRSKRSRTRSIPQRAESRN